MERIAVYAGSFDPVTLGHMDIIRRGAALFDRLVVLVQYNPAKSGTFPVDTRVAMLKRCVRDLPNVEVDTSSGFTVRYAQSIGARYLLRGVRSAADMDAEQTLIDHNRHFAPELETVLLSASSAYRHISSTGVREIAKFHENLTGFVPEDALDTIQAHFA